jgi:hypothetical protein
MAVQHELIIRDGLDAVLARTASAKMRASLKIAADILAQEAEGGSARSYLHSVLCTIYLPHRRTSPTASWEKTNGDGAVMMIHPIPDRQGRHLGVPYGSTGRLLIIFLTSEAYRNRSRRVQLGASMCAWLRTMGVSISGQGYRAVKEQALRIERSLISVSYRRKAGEDRWQDTIIRGSFNLDPADRDAFPEAVELSESFYESLARHPAILFDPAIRHLAGKSLALDVYCWLAYRLHMLERPALISWEALHRAFGANYRRVRDFRANFRQPLDDALNVYPQAVVEPGEAGLLLRPSAPPGPPRSVAYLGRRPVAAQERGAAVRRLPAQADGRDLPGQGKLSF